MIYTVVLLQTAEDELTLIWIRRVGDRAGVTAASHRIELALRRDPDQKGVPLDDGSRLYIDGPLAAIFEVNADDRIVTITHFQEV
jgi:hypothetical protein